MKKLPERVPTRPGDPAAVVGVVLAGIVAMVVSPGSFDWWATMIGLTLLAVLWGYAHEPTSVPESVGLATAVALSLIWTIGAPLEMWFSADLSGEGHNGGAVIGMWAVIAVVVCALLEERRARRGIGPIGRDPDAADQNGSREKRHEPLALTSAARTAQPPDPTPTGEGAASHAVGAPEPRDP